MVFKRLFTGVANMGSYFLPIDIEHLIKALIVYRYIMSSAV